VALRLAPLGARLVRSLRKRWCDVCRRALTELDAEVSHLQLRQRRRRPFRTGVTDAVADAPPNMYITTPSGNDIVQRVDPGSGEACLRVAGFGYDEEDKDFATIDYWETNRSDLQIKALSFDQNTTVCLKAVPEAPSTVHQIRLRGFDKKGHLGISAPLQVTVLPAIH
jgi:hypothetical protein